MTGGRIHPLLRQGLRQVALIRKDFPEEALHQTRNGLAIIDVAGGQGQVQQFASVVEQQMSLEAKEPAGRTLAPLRHSRKDLVLMNAMVVADGQRRGIQERNAGAGTQATAQIGAQGQAGAVLIPLRRRQTARCV